MKDVIIVETHDWRTSGFTLACFGLLCITVGYLLAGIQVGAPKSVQPSSPASAMEKWTSLALQQAKPGDYVILSDGRVLRLSGPTQETVVEGDRVYYNTRMTLGGHFEKPLWQMASDTAAIINPTSVRYAIIDKCFNKGMFVTTVGPAKWTCT